MQKSKLQYYVHILCWCGFICAWSILQNRSVITGGGWLLSHHSHAIGRLQRPHLSQQPHDGGVGDKAEWRLPVQRAHRRPARLTAAEFIAVCSGEAKGLKLSHFVAWWLVIRNCVFDFTDFVDYLLFYQQFLCIVVCYSSVWNYSHVQMLYELILLAVMMVLVKALVMMILMVLIRDVTEPAKIRFYLIWILYFKSVGFGCGCVFVTQSRKSKQWIFIYSYPYMLFTKHRIGLKVLVWFTI